MLGLGGVFFDVAAEADDEIVYGAGVGVFVQAPDVFENGFAGDGAAFAADQVTQEFGFHEGELDRFVVGAQLKRSEINGLAVEGKNFGIGCGVCSGSCRTCAGFFPVGCATFCSGFFGEKPLAPAQQTLQPGEKYRQLKRFGKVVVSAGCKSLQNIFGAAARSENQNGNVIVSFAQGGDDGETVFAGEHYVQHDDVEFFVLCDEAIEGGFAVAGNFDGVAFGFKVEAQAFGEVRFVFDHQHAAHATFLGNSREMVEPRPSPSLAA